MNGTILPRGKCPVCHKSFSPIRQKGKTKILGYKCPRHLTTPDRFRISLYHHRRLFIYSNKQGRILDSYIDAVELLKQINAELDAGKFDSSKYVRMEQSQFWVSRLADVFWKEKKDKLRPSYQADFKRMLDRASNFFGPLDVRELRKPQIIDFQKTFAHLSPKTQKNHLDLLKTFLRWVRDDREKIERVPLFPLVEKEVKMPRWISTEDQQRILDHVPAEDRPIINFCMTYGCRQGEARALRVQDIDWPNQTINIHSTFSGNVVLERRKGRGAPPLSLPIMPEVAPFLQKRLKEALPAAFVFVNPRTGNPYQEATIGRLWDRVRNLAGIDKSLRLYDATRHSVASNLRKRGADIAAIKDILGHTDIRTTMRYAHADLESKKTSLELLSASKLVYVSGMCLEPDASKKG
jgi:integrase